MNGEEEEDLPTGNPVVLKKGHGVNAPRMRSRLKIKNQCAEVNHVIQRINQKEDPTKPEHLIPVSVKKITFPMVKAQTNLL